MGIVTGRFPYADSAKLMFPTPPEGFRMLTQHFQIMTALHIPLFVRRSKMIMAKYNTLVDGAFDHVGGGLHNMGHTCFANSVIQGLVYRRYCVMNEYHIL